MPAEGSCLVTGASGFIGGHLVERLIADGRAVRCLVRETSDRSLLDSLGVEFALGDLTSADSLASATKGCRHVFHCGALVSDWGTVEEITRINVDGTRHLLRAAIAAGVERFIHFSTTDVYGYPGGEAITEDYIATSFGNWYAQTKRAAEAEVRAASGERGLEVVLLRPATVYGPRSAEVVGEIARAIRNRTMVLIDGGRAVAGLAYVENVIDAAMLALTHAAAPGQAFNLTDGVEVTWRHFTDDLASGLGCPRVRWSMPYWLAHGVGFSLESGYRLLRRGTGLSTPALLSRQAVNVMGKDQAFSNQQGARAPGLAAPRRLSDGP